MLENISIVEHVMYAPKIVHHSVIDNNINHSDSSIF